MQPYTVTYEHDPECEAEVIARAVELLIVARSTPATKDIVQSGALAVKLVQLFSAVEKLHPREVKA